MRLLVNKALQGLVHAIFNHYFTLDVLLLVLIEIDKCVFMDTKEMTMNFV